MARIAGRNGRLYVAIASGATSAEPVAFLNKYSINFTSDKFDVTSFGDTTKVYVAGFADCQGTYAGFYDDATNQLFDAATTGTARNFYLYTDTSTATSSTTDYFWGTAIFDFSIDGDVGGPVAISGSFAAASAVSRHT
jgi:hypothetical protein